MLFVASACSGLSGRALRDGGVDVADAATMPASDGARDGAAPDASRCPRRDSVTVARSAQFGATASGDAVSNPAVRGGFVDHEGRVVVVGNCLRCGPEAFNGSRLAAWRFRWDTLALDDAFGAGGVALDASPASRAFSEAIGGFVDGAGRLVLFGHESPAGNNNQALVVRLRSDGALDPTWADHGRFVLTRARLGSARGVVAFAAAYDARGAVVLVNDGGHWAAESQRAWAVRLTDAGALDEGFGEGGVADITGAVGCFDVALDGEVYVLACMSPNLRPRLLRLDGAGRVIPWPGGARAEAEQAPRRFEVRSLARDPVGRWVVTGAATTFYSDASSSAVAVRFAADGTPDRTFGADGVAAILGPRSTFAYGFHNLTALSCEERLLVGGNVGAIPVVSVLDGRGQMLAEVGMLGSVALREAPGLATVHAVLRREGTDDVVAVVSHGSSALSLHRLEQ